MERSAPDSSGPTGGAGERMQAAPDKGMKSDSGPRPEKGAASSDKPMRDTAKSEKGEGARDTKKSGDTAKSESGPNDHKNAANKGRGEDTGDTGRSEGAEGKGGESGGSVTQLSGEKRTKVQSAFRSHRSEAVVKDIDISINVGVNVPRSVTLYAVPEDVVVIVPAYRRYKYFIYEDKVVIVDPASYAIIDVLILT